MPCLWANAGGFASALKFAHNHASQSSPPNPNGRTDGRRTDGKERAGWTHGRAGQRGRTDGGAGRAEAARAEDSLLSLCVLGRRRGRTDERTARHGRHGTDGQDARTDGQTERRKRRTKKARSWLERVIVDADPETACQFYIPWAGARLEFAS